MLAQRILARGPPRMGAQLRATTQRRFASTTENVFVKDRKATKEHATGTTDLWKKISIYGAVPCLLLAAGNAYMLWNEHWEHWDHLPPLEERTEYPYQNIRSKNFSWGNGDRSLFWNDKVNYHNHDKVK